jgi:hypothetical protein
MGRLGENLRQHWKDDDKGEEEEEEEEEEGPKRGRRRNCGREGMVSERGG